MDTDRTYRIRKQKFQKSVARPFYGNISWPLNLDVYDKMGDYSHDWKINVVYSHGDDTWITILGQQSDLKYKYSKCYCKVDLLSGCKTEKEVVLRTKRFMNAPSYNNFHFQFIFSLKYLHENIIVNFPDVKEITLAVTLGSCDETKLEPLNPKYLLDQGILTDVVIKTKGKQFPCHKAILAARSEYFQAMFLTDMNESKENVVNWYDVFETDTVQDTLHFIYTGRAPPNIERNCFQLIEVANLCLLNGLKNLCVRRMQEIICVEKAADVLLVAEKFDLDEVKKTAANYIALHHKEVLSSVGWRRIPLDMTPRLLATVFCLIGTNSIKMCQCRKSH